MIITLILQLLVSTLNIALSWLPTVTSLNLPGFPIDDYLSTGMGYVWFIAGIIPPLSIMLTGFLWVLSWKVTLLTLRFLKIFR